MENLIPQGCPSCGKLMHIRSLRCPSCSTEVQGDYSQDSLTRLSPEQRIFLLTFMKCRGSLKDLGTALGISYPTARSRLDTLIQALDIDDPPRQNTRIEILTMLKNGDISTEEALELLKGEKNNGNG